MTHSRSTHRRLLAAAIREQLERGQIETRPSSVCTLMANTPNQADGRIASLALAVIDLRAHFEAQLRRIARAEEALVKCRAAKSPMHFHSSASALRGEVQVVSDNNRSVRTVIDQMRLDARDLVFPSNE